MIWIFFCALFGSDGSDGRHCYYWMQYLTSVPLVYTHTHTHGRDDRQTDGTDVGLRGFKGVFSMVRSNPFLAPSPPPDILEGGFDRVVYHNNRNSTMCYALSKTFI